MSLIFSYQPKLPHSIRWSAGYSIGSSCKYYYKTWFCKKGNGPKNGEKIILRNLPCHNDTYIRFWAAKPSNNGEDKWDSFNSAYDEDNSMMEKEPDIHYFNGGMVKVEKNGKATFRLFLPLGYMSKNGYISSHFHYRLCSEGKMGPVHTEFIRNSCYHNNCDLSGDRETHELDIMLKRVEETLDNDKSKSKSKSKSKTKSDCGCGKTINSDNDGKEDRDNRLTKHKHYKEPPYKGSSNKIPYPDLNNNHMCDTFTSPQPCNNYKILPGPVSGNLFGPSYAIQHF